MVSVLISTAMKCYQEYAVITLLVVAALCEVQGKGVQDTSSLKSLASQHNWFVKIMKENYDLRNMAKGSPPALRVVDTMENTLSLAENPKRFPNYNQLREIQKGIITPENHFKLAKSYDNNVTTITKSSNQDTNGEANLLFNPAVRKSFRTQKVYCRQITRNDPNHQGNIIESIQHICAASPKDIDIRKPLETSNPPLPYALNEKHFRQFTDSSTPRGINCRRIMNSELNELGEIVDSVTELCDPPATTTRKPIVTTTTPKMTTTTPEPLVKVCRPVMDSYLNEEGQIVDSVAMVCKMERAN